MQYIEIQSGLKASKIIVGCMRISSKSEKEVSQLINKALELGINFFDHADIYGGGKSEEIFGSAFDRSLRDKVIIQTKCGIRNGYYDLSKEHIITSVEKSLKRLKTGYIDVLLLHRPDALMELEEIAEAFSYLHTNGLVRYFGVSNFNPMQIELLQKYLSCELIIDQIQFGVGHTPAIDYGVNFNMKNEFGINRDGSIIEYCRLNEITIQAWSPLLYGFFEENILNRERFPELNKVFEDLSTKYDVPISAIPIAWILRHPAKMQVVVGTTNLKHLEELCKATEIDLTREDWYKIYRSAGNFLP